MADLPAIPVAEFSPAWHQYQVLLRDRLEAQNAALIARIEALEVIAVPEPEDTPEGILLQGSSTVVNSSGTGLFKVATVILTKDFQLLEDSSRLIVRGSLQFDVGDGTNDANGFKIYLYQDAVNTGKAANVSWLSINGVNFPSFQFDYLVGDISNHTYTIVVTASSYAQIRAKLARMMLEEWRV